MQPDTLIPDPTNPQAFNRYSYVGNNPVNFNDPTGHIAIGDSNNEAGCSGKGPKCIIDMYYRANDDQGMDDSLRAFLRRHKDYNPHTDVELIPEEITIVVGAMFQNAIQDRSAGELGSTGTDLIILGIIVGGSIPMMGPDGGGGGGRWSTGRGPRNAIEQAAWNKVAANPWNGRKLPWDLGDPRWPPEEGWVKMSRTVDGVEIHWNLNTFTGAVEDMKIP